VDVGERAGKLGDLVDLVTRVEQAAGRRGEADTPVSDRLGATVRALRTDHRKRKQSSVAERLTGLAEVFGLDPMAADLLLVAAAPDLDANFALAYGLLRGGDSAARASVGLALELCELPSLSADGVTHLGAPAPLREHGLVDVAGHAPWLLREVEVADRVVSHLLGSDDLEPALAAALLPSVPVDFPAARSLAAALQAGAPLAWVRAAPGTSGLSLAAGALASLGVGRLVVDLGRAGNAAAAPDLLRAATREAALRGVGLIVVGADRLAAMGAAGLAHLETAIVPVVLIGGRPWDSAWLARHPFTVDAPVLKQEQRAEVWRTAGGYAEPPEGLGALRLTPERITQTLSYAGLLARTESAEVSDELLLRAARVVGGSHTAGKRSTLSFADLVLPEHAGAALHRLVSWARHRDNALARSRMFDADTKGSGITALFSGSPGTGKTLSANVVAGELGLDLFQVNLTEIVDKYIGETEKNLEKIFDEAESLNVVLFFDEADALFGRRSEVKDAHDRYANQEVAYLLQRIETFDGITILATNLRGNLDQAFSRRLQFIITFPDPDPPTRRRLWSLYVDRLDFLDPADAPDLDYLADTLEFAGGDIRNVVLAAVYDATAANELLGMRHLQRAAMNEYQKLGRRLAKGAMQPQS
jgi:hypothetical protein